MLDAHPLTDESLDELDKYLVDPRSGPTSPRAPRFVHAAVASLVEPAAVKAAVTTYEAGSTQPTVWRVHAVTDRSLAFTEVQFDDEFYTAEEENNRGRYKIPPAKVVLREAWVRPLDAIVEYAVDNVLLLTDTGRCLVAARVKFREVEGAVELPSQLGNRRDDQRSRADELLRRIRDAVGRNAYLEREAGPRAACS